jgi:hypothetical protein
MPDPLLYLKSMADAAIASAMVVLVILFLGRWATRKWRITPSLGSFIIHLACILGIGVGLAIGYAALSLELNWPPTSGLDRLLTLVLPVALVIEFISGIPCVPRYVTWVLRIVLAAMIPRVLLHGSVYLSELSGWTALQFTVTLGACSMLLAGVWGLLLRLASRSPGLSIPSSVCLALLCTAATVMMAGYLKGGASALPLVSTLMVTMIALLLATRRFDQRRQDFKPTQLDSNGILGIGVVGLFGLLFIGRFFGEISSGDALIIFLAPLFGWVTETRLLRNRKPWVVGCLRLAIVALPLVVVLILAKRNFDRDMAPLLVGKDASVEISVVVVDR